MPNWCENDLTIEGDNVSAVMDAIEGIDHDGEKLSIDFQKILPFPEGVDMMEDVEVPMLTDPNDTIMAPRWWTWSTENWGTKWNASPCFSCDIEDHKATMTFETAWAPPDKAIRALAKMFPDHTFTLNYFEAGWGFEGCLRIKGDEVLEEEYSHEYQGGRGG